MSTYYNKKSEEIPIGTEFKLNVHMDPVDGKHLGDDDVDFTCSFYAKEEVILKKSQMIEVDENNYVAPLNSEALGLGTIGFILEVDIPDDDFPDSLRHEVVPIETKYKIVPTRKS